jgi:hypothetical protein
VPPLYHQLYRWSGGPIETDHCWHEFVGFREIAEGEEGYAPIPAGELVGRFAAVNDWDEALSPHFALDVA